MFKKLSRDMEDITNSQMELLEMFESSEIKIHSIKWMVDSTLQKKGLVNSEALIEIIQNETQRERKIVFKMGEELMSHGSIPSGLTYT